MFLFFCQLNINQLIFLFFEGAKLLKKDVITKGCKITIRYLFKNKKIVSLPRKM